MAVVGCLGLMAVAMILALPVLGVLGAWWGLDAASWATLVHQAQTVLPAYAGQSLLLLLGVGAGVVTLGGVCAAAVTLFEFPGRRWLEWALLLPLALPAYVMAYAYTDALQFSGPIQTALRELVGAQRPLWPDVRSLWGAVLVFTLSLYPYVYLLARTALGGSAAPALEAARLLGASLPRRLLAVALPMARPALAAGTALALMETLADYGVGAYFGLTTFTTGIYRAWLVLEDRMAAAQLASVLLVLVAWLLWAEQRAQSRLRFASARVGMAGALTAQPVVLRGLAQWGAWCVCGVPVLLGFGLPVAWLGWLLWQEFEGRASAVFEPAYLARFGQWAWTSFQLAGLAAVVGVAVALALGFALRRTQAGAGVAPRWLGRGLAWAVRAVGLGYAVPGTVIAVGILLWAGALQRWLGGLPVTALVTGTIFGLCYAYLARFSSVALQSVQSGYARVPVAVDESARLLGARGARVLWEIHWPLLGRSTLAAALLVFVDTMKELPATLMLRPFGCDTLAVVAYQFARDERLAEAALPSVAMVAVGLIPVLILSRALRSA